MGEVYDWEKDGLKIPIELTPFEIYTVSTCLILLEEKELAQRVFTQAILKNVDAMAMEAEIDRG